MLACLGLKIIKELNKSSCLVNVLIKHCSISCSFDNKTCKVEVFLKSYCGTLK